MIGKSRLIELIKKGATIYSVDTFCNVRALRLKKYGMTIIGNYLYMCKNCEYNIEYLYETKKEVQWVVDNWNARVEKFEPPFELKDGQTYSFNSIYGYKCYLIGDKGGRFGDYDRYLIFRKDTDKTYVLVDTRFYEEAVKFAKKLFLGDI
jgi:hypothetical protein